jgi:hypothetical protein
MALRTSELLSHMVCVTLNWQVRVPSWEHRSLRAGHPNGKRPEPFPNAIGTIVIVSRAALPKSLRTRTLTDIQA